MGAPILKINPAIAIIQARMSSSRLPGKVMMNLAGKPLIWHIYERAKKCKYVKEIIIATSVHKSDDELVEYCIENNMNYHRGSLNNVLQRFLETLSIYDFKYYVRVTGDCPLICPQFIDNQIYALNRHDGDITWTLNLGEALLGQGVHSVRSLKYIADRIDDCENKEHVGTIYMSKNPHLFRLVELNPPSELLNENRLTIDEKTDLMLIRALYADLFRENKIISIKDALLWLNNNPEIRKTNLSVQHSSVNTQTRLNERKWISVPKVGKAIYDVNM